MLSAPIVVFLAACFVVGHAVIVERGKLSCLRVPFPSMHKNRRALVIAFGNAAFAAAAAELRKHNMCWCHHT
ncbi:Hypothetical predicted protein [Cloeon dipterum]|uniref:Secreted protein n=1 Tax=Cloeon dipterum TaxID=197152 RepID=A0A8S1DHF2_9INSE|nr:Hypothetical predicted protein [Cloeon dipterum]